MQKILNKKNETKLKMLYVFIYAPIGVLCPLIGQYLSSIGFSGTEIGIITSISTGVAVFSSTFWGKIYANSKDGKIIIFVLCVCASLMGIANMMITSFLIFTISYGVMYFFQGPTMGLSDAMVLETKADFASIRLCGSIGYAISVYFGGKIGQVFGLDKIFIIYSVTFVLGGFIVLTVNKSGKNEVKNQADFRKSNLCLSRGNNKKDKIGFKLLIKEKKAVQLIICGIFLFGTGVANNTYFGFLYKDGGGTVAGVGTAFLLMVGSEAPFMALAPKLSKWFSQQKVIAAAMVVSALRFGWYATGPSNTFLLLTFFLQGIVNGILLVEYMKYIASVVHINMIGIAVSAFYAISSSLGTILCNFFGGVAMDAYGSQGVYALFAILNIIGIILFFIFGLNKNSKTVG